MFDVVNERLPRWWGLLPLRLIVGFAFIAHGYAKWSAGPERFGKFLHLIGAPAPGVTAWAVMLVEKINLLYIGALLALALLGSGPLSLDRLFVTRTQREKDR